MDKRMDYEKIELSARRRQRIKKGIVYFFLTVWGLMVLFPFYWIPCVAQLVKNPPAVEETWVRSLGWEDPLEKGKATQSSILAWRIPWTL